MLRSNRRHSSFNAAPDLFEFTTGFYNLQEEDRELTSAAFLHKKKDRVFTRSMHLMVD